MPLCILISCAATLASAQSMTSFVNEVNALSDPAAKETKVDSLMAAISAFPWADGDTAHFIYRGSASDVQIAGDFNGWTPGGGNALNLSGTDFWYYSRVFESNARMDYKVVLNGSSWNLDALNPNTVSGGFGPNSELAMPDYVQPWEIEDLGNPAGTIETINVSSSFTGKTYSVQIYLPPGYDPLASYPATYFHDGHEYVGLASTAIVFDNLIADGLVEPLIGVFIRPTDRNAEYAFEDRFDYADFCLQELVPYVDANYATDSQRHRRAIIGASFGGNISGLIAHRDPSIFGNVGLHSAAFWPNSNEVYNDWVLATPPNDLRIASIWGSYEGSLSTNNVDFQSGVLQASGFDHIWDELPEGHSWGLWRATVDDMVTFFFPPGGVGIGEMDQSQALLFPNPASDFVQFDPGSELCLDGILSIMSLDGKLIQQEQLQAGGACGVANIRLKELNPGFYLLQFDSQGRQYSKSLTIER